MSLYLAGISAAILKNYFACGRMFLMKMKVGQIERLLIYCLSNFLGFAHFLGNLFISIKIRVAYTYVLQGLKIQFCLRPCLMTGLGEILEA